MKLVVIRDGGHGYFTPGKRPFDDSMREAHFNYAVAELLNEKLGNFENVEVHTVYDITGKEDTPLSVRTKRANDIYKKYEAEIKAGTVKIVYISIHANAAGTTWNAARGFETYIHPNASEETKELQAAIHYAILAYTKQQDRGMKKANFQVLRETKMEALLIEAAFMTNKEDLALLKSVSFRNIVAQGIVNGLVRKYGLKVKPQPVKAPEVKPAANDMYRVQVFAGSYEGAKQVESRLQKDGYPATTLKL